jgi:hypothetical protein
MANFNKVNAAVKKQYPSMDIQVVRGVGYVYFNGEDGFDIVDSIYSHPVSTTTDDMVKMVIENIKYAHGS